MSNDHVGPFVSGNLQDAKHMDAGSKRPYRPSMADRVPRPGRQ